MELLPILYLLELFHLEDIPCLAHVNCPLRVFHPILLFSLALPVVGPSFILCLLLSVRPMNTMSQADKTTGDVKKKGMMGRETEVGGRNGRIGQRRGWGRYTQ